MDISLFNICNRTRRHTIRIVREPAIIAMLACGGLGDGGQSYDSEKAWSLPIRVFFYNIGTLHPAVMIRSGREILGKQLFFYCVYFRCTPETHIQRQTALHDCLPRLLGEWGHINWNSARWGKNILDWACQCSQGRIKVSCIPAWRAQWTNQGRSPFICTLWVPVFNSLVSLVHTYVYVYIKQKAVFNGNINKLQLLGE